MNPPAIAVTMATFSLLMSSSTALRSSIHSSSVGSAVAGTGSDKPTPRLVEADHARECGQTVVEPRERSDFALDLDVAEPLLGHDDVHPPPEARVR